MDKSCLHVSFINHLGCLVMRLSLILLWGYIIIINKVH